MRMTCLPIGRDRCLLPAFSEFADPLLIQPALSDRIRAISRDYLVSIPISLLQPLE
jgi:hypothetical protein